MNRVFICLKVQSCTLQCSSRKQKPDVEAATRAGFLHIKVDLTEEAFVQVTLWCASQCPSFSEPPSLIPAKRFGDSNFLKRLCEFICHHRSRCFPEGSQTSSCWGLRCHQRSRASKSLILSSTCSHCNWKCASLVTSFCWRIICSDKAALTHLLLLAVGADTYEEATASVLVLSNKHGRTKVRNSNVLDRFYFASEVTPEGGP